MGLSSLLAFTIWSYHAIVRWDIHLSCSILSTILVPRKWSIPVSALSIISQFSFPCSLSRCYHTIEETYPALSCPCCSYNERIIWVGIFVVTRSLYIISVIYFYLWSVIGFPSVYSLRQLSSYSDIFVTYEFTNVLKLSSLLVWSLEAPALFWYLHYFVFKNCLRFSSFWMMACCW